jgi:hypothetical protein
MTTSTTQDPENYLHSAASVDHFWNVHMRKPIASDLPGGQQSHLDFSQQSIGNTDVTSSDMVLGTKAIKVQFFFSSIIWEVHGPIHVAEILSAAVKLRRR